MDFNRRELAEILTFSSLVANEFERPFGRMRGCGASWPHSDSASLGKLPLKRLSAPTPKIYSRWCPESRGLALNERGQKLYGTFGYRTLEAKRQELLREPHAEQTSWRRTFRTRIWLCDLRKLDYAEGEIMLERTMAEWDGRGLVSTDWLADHLNDPDLRVYDAAVHLRPATPGPYRVESGRADYETAHIPGAARIDIARDLSDADAPLPFTKPSTDKLAHALGAAGIKRGVRVVVYSSTTPMWATRFWWLLRASGFDEVAVLDGGFAKWKSEARPVEAGARQYPPEALSLAARPGAWADKESVLAAISDGAVCIINALAANVHSGEAPVNYGRKGHIKGSRNVPYASLLTPDGLYRADPELRALFDAVGAFERPNVICYCGGGISATMDALALTRLGHPAVSVYDGSMTEWSRDPNLPMESRA